MSSVILWLPGDDLLPKAPLIKADRSATKKEPDPVARSTPKKRSSQATLLQDQGEVCPILSNFVYLSNVSKPCPILTDCQSLTTSVNSDNLSTLDYIEADTPQAWAQALQEIEAAGICGLDLETTGLDPLSSRARLCQLSLPSGRVYVADLWELARGGSAPLQDLARLTEDPNVKIVGHNLKFDLSFIQASQGRRLKMSNLFDTMLASQVCWAGYDSLAES